MKTKFVSKTTCLALTAALLFTLMPQVTVATEAPSDEEEIVLIEEAPACEDTVSSQESNAARIVRQPVDAAAILGDKVSVSVEAIGKGLKYYWYYRDTSARNFSRSSITASTYTLTMTEERANREVYCVITDTYDNRIQTDTATLLLAVKDELEIVQQPVSDDALPGEVATVFVEAKGDALKYQWYYRDAGAKNFSRSSIKESTYTLTMTEARVNREVYCVVTDAHGNKVTSDVVMLMLKTEPEVETTYYATLGDALTGMYGSAEQTGASVEVKIAADETRIVLLQDVELAETVVIDSDVTLDLNGHQIVSAAEEAIIVRADAVIDGTVPGSGMTAIAAAQQKATLIHLESGSLTVNGGVYETVTTNAGTSTNQAAAVIAESGTMLAICNAEITAKDTADGSVVGVMGKADSVLEVTDSTVIVSSGTGLENVSVHTKGDAKLTNCTVIAEANYTANAAGTAYASNSRGVYIEGSLEMYDCYVWGSHAGVTAKGAVYVNGGTYEGYGHGGIYLSGAGTTSYLYNAELNWAEMREGTFADEVAGTNGAGMYIGGASNVTVYMDHCDVYGTLYGVVLRRSGGEKYNNVYISNSEVEGSRCAFRIQKASATTLLVYSGVGDTFSTPSIDFPANMRTTDESYAKP